MLENIMVREWMTSPVVSVTPSTPISSAHQMMKEYNIRRLPVVDEDRLVGIVTLGDVREASPSDANSLSIWELNYLWAQLTVDRVMTRRVVTVKPEALILDAAAMMYEHKIGGLPVVGNDDRLVGIVTESDVFKMLIESRSKAIMPKAT
ncbi:MAG: CBS domain-containing protein [Chloroflexi bacterium]|nr:CBS domain-containing protein [Chloroflexota bacterium]